ncbi:hypothetical protein ACHAW6_003460 [Cyclotella cf. meneghiniana]
MKRTKAIATLLFCRPIHITPFAPSPGTKRTRVHSHDESRHLHAQRDTIVHETDSSSSTRRTFLAAATLFPFALTSSCAAARDSSFDTTTACCWNIGLLFALLPSSRQPVDALRVRFENAVDMDVQSAPLPASTPLPKISLPKAYNTTTKSFQIIPAWRIYEIGINEETGTTAISTIFGLLSSQPLTRTRPNLGKDYYTLLGISGGVRCALTHALVIPLDVVKMRMQTNPGEHDGKGSPPYFLAHKPPLLDIYVAHANDVALVAGAVASIVASLGLTPIEAARIRAVAEPEIHRDKGLLGTVSVIGREDEELGWRNLYAGLPSLMTRQVIFGSVKFLAFERASEAIFAAWPGLRDATFTALGVSLVAGGFAGVLSSVVSQPADSVLTYVTKQHAGGNLDLLNGAKIMVQRDGVGSLFRGLGSRCVWAGCIIAGQFLLYDVFRGLFGITGDDLNQVFEFVLLPQ